MVFAVLGAPAAWALHLVAGYLLEEAACSAAFRDAVGDTAVRLGIVLLTLALAAVAALASTMSYGAWQGRGEPADGATLPDFLFLAGLLMGIVFTLAILLAGSAGVVLEVCA